MSVRALLDGHQFDLMTLAELFPSGDPHVEKDGDDYHLVASALDPYIQGDHGRMHELAGQILDQLIGVARLHDSSFRTATVAGRYDLPDHTVVYGGDQARGRDRVSVVTAEVRMRANAVMVVGGAPAPPQPSGPRYLALAQAHADVAELLDLLGRSDNLPWGDLYKAFEIIRDSAGKNGPKSLAALGFSDRISAFKASANRPDVSGPDARHARMSGTSPAQTMALPEGQQFIRELAEKWLNTLT